jgi:hypothetical protein
VRVTYATLSAVDMWVTVGIAGFGWSRSLVSTSGHAASRTSSVCWSEVTFVSWGLAAPTNKATHELLHTRVAVFREAAALASS